MWEAATDIRVGTCSASYQQVTGKLNQLRGGTISKQGCFSNRGGAARGYEFKFDRALRPSFGAGVFSYHFRGVTKMNGCGSGQGFLDSFGREHFGGVTELTKMDDERCATGKDFLQVGVGVAEK